MSDDDLASKYFPGDLVYLEPKRKFPLVLRSGPGYTSERIDVIEPGEIALILDSSWGHGMVMWTYVLVGQKKRGWVPEAVVYNVLSKV